MTQSSYTRRIERSTKQKAAMLAQTGKRLTTRITDHVQEKLQADNIIESQSTIVLTRRESLRLLELIENPPPRNEKFLQAMNRYQRMKNNDLSTTE